MKKRFVVHLTTVIAVVFCLSLIPLAIRASDSRQTLQQFSQSVEDIVGEITPSIVKIKVDISHRFGTKEERYFKDFPPDYRWREEDWERHFKPEQFRFFFKAPEKGKNSDVSPEIKKFFRDKDLKDFSDIRGWIEALPRPYGRYYQQYDSGLSAGIIVNPDGYIVTASYLIEKADEIKVTLSDGREFDAELIGSDSKTGIAVIKIEADELMPGQLGDSEQLSIGEIVIAIGHPHGFDNTVSLGVISGLERRANITEYDNLIQTDAVIGRGSAGGPLVNAGGEVVGMNIAVFSEGGGYQGIGFAIPINTVKRIQEQLIESGKVVRGWLGVYIQEVSHELAEKFQLEKVQGVMVNKVMDDSPASHAGIEEGDVIITFDGKSLKDVNHLRHLVADIEPGKTVVVTVIGDGEEQDIEVTIGEMPTDVARTVSSRKRGEIQKGRLGIVVQDVDEYMAEKFMLEEPKGALVSHVADGSPAEAAGIKEGDIIVAFEGQTIEDSKQLQKLIAETEAGKKIITIVRDGNKQDIEVTISETPSEGIKWRGLTLQELTGERAEELGYESDKGVSIISVNPDSRARRAGLKANDLIIEVEKQPISNVTEFQDAVKDLEGNVLLRIKRGEIAQFVIVK